MATYVTGDDDGIGFGVRGNSFAPHTGKGVEGFSTSNDGVYGEARAANSAGVRGEHTGKGTLIAGPGVVGKSDYGEGVHGETNSEQFAGVAGVAMNAEGEAAGVSGESVSRGPGVLGTTNGEGPAVFGQANASGIGVLGTANREAGVIGFHGDPALQETTAGSEGAKAGVFGASENGAGVLGYARSKDMPAVYAFGGLLAIALGKDFAGEFRGHVKVEGDILLTGADCAEQFDVIDAADIEPGSVLVINETGGLRQSDSPYDTKVAGVVSGAGDYQPGMILDQRQSSAGRLCVALMGKAYCKIDASYGAIAVGDLLTTSPTPGHAMKASDSRRAFGAVLGKALHPWDSGRGFIPTLVLLG
jgi:hypothetical protein